MTELRFLLRNYQLPAFDKRGRALPANTHSYKPLITHNNQFFFTVNTPSPLNHRHQTNLNRRLLMNPSNQTDPSPQPPHPAPNLEVLPPHDPPQKRAAGPKTRNGKIA